MLKISLTGGDLILAQRSPRRMVAGGGETAHSLFKAFTKYGCNGRRVRMLKIEVEREEDGRWIAEVPALPGVLAYGTPRPKRGRMPSRWHVIAKIFLARKRVANRFSRAQGARLKGHRENVLQELTCPLLSPVVSHLARCADEPCVKLSGTA